MEEPRAHLPILVGDEESLERFLHGAISLRPWIGEAEWDEAVRPYETCLRPCADGRPFSSAERVAFEKELVNQVDRFAKVFDFCQIELDVSDGAWLPLDGRFKKLGQCAVIVADPIALFNRIEPFANDVVPGYFRLEAGNLRYVDDVAPVEFRDVYEAPAAQEWRKGVRLCLREGGSVALGTAEPGFGIPPIVDLHVGDLHDICIKANVEDLVHGRFPERLYDAEAIRRIVRDQGSSRSIVHSVTFGGDVVDVAPIQGWIEKVLSALPDGDWRPRTVVETVPESRAALPRLAFDEPAWNLNVAFWSNRVELACLAETPDARCALTSSALGIAEMLHALNGKGFALLGYRSLVELGRGPADGDRRSWHHSDSRLEDGLLVERVLFQEGRLVPNAFGFGEAADSLACSFEVRTDPDDKTMWYLPGDLGRFLEVAFSRSEDYLRAVVDGDPVEQYMRLVVAVG